MCVCVCVCVFVCVCVCVTCVHAAYDIKKKRQHLVYFTTTLLQSLFAYVNSLKINVNDGCLHIYITVILIAVNDYNVNKLVSILDSLLNIM